MSFEFRFVNPSANCDSRNTPPRICQRLTLFRLCLFLLFAGSLIGSSPLSAYAQLWKRVYSGGTYTKGGAPLTDFAATTYGDQDGNSGGGYGAQIPQNTSASFSCQGAITATFTWVGPNMGYGPPTPPPATVVVEETVSANWAYSTPVKDKMGNCDNGIGSPQVSNGTAPIIGSLSKGTRYRKISVGSNGTFTVSCTPTANVSVTAQPTTDSYATANVSYQAKVVQIAIQFDGTTLLNQNDQILVGQECIPSIICTQSGFVKFTSWQWSVSGNPHDVFKDYSADGSTGKVNYLAATDWQVENPSLFWRVKGGVNVTCTASASFSDGSTKSYTLSATVTVVAPDFALNNVYTEVHKEVNENRIRAGDKSITPPIIGVSFSGWVLTPTTFVTPNSSGKWGIAQLVTSDRRATKLNGTAALLPVQTGAARYLDTFYPYNPFQPWTVAKKSGDPGAGMPVEYANDSPSQFLDDSLYKVVSVNDQFFDYMMYYPPPVTGHVVQAVPLQNENWKFFGQCSFSGGTWKLDTVPASALNKTGMTSFPEHPEWTKNVSTP